ncbi:MAG: hypothetical protein JXR97_00565 [Planctomycetes bacterium]|nr:hypothetical protein [Planctomycetota bacterium]
MKCIKQRVFILGLVLNLLFVLTCSGGERRGAISFTAPKSATVYSPVEFRSESLAAAYAKLNPYNPDILKVDGIITTPSGKQFIQPAFFSQNYSRAESEEGAELLTPEGKSYWAIRFCPTTTGIYKVSVLVAAKGEEEKNYSVGSVTVSEAKEKPDGFLRVNKKNPSRFIFDSGKGYFALGHNVCWVAKGTGTYGFEKYFKRMEEAGENYTRIWLCTWGVSLETSKPYVYNSEGAWQLDRILEDANERSIAVKLCLYNFYDFNHNPDKLPYTVDNGGPCKSKADFFVGSGAKKLTKAKLRYLVARYSAYTSLMAWELWNEMNYTLSYLDEGPSGQLIYDDEERKKILLPWTNEMVGEFEKLDPYRHMTTTSLGNNELWDDLWKDDKISFAQFHSYIHYLDMLRIEAGKDAAAYVLMAQSAVSTYNKPAFIAEFGFMGSGETSPINPEDPSGIALHNAIWAGAFSGAAGIPALWWWDNYIDPNNLYSHYKGLSTFLKDIDWNRQYKPMRAESKDIRVLALRNSACILLWVQNRQNTWYNRIRKELEPERMKGFSLALENFEPGTYKVEWFDPYGIKILSESTQESPDGSLNINVPSFKFDIAGKLSLVR